MAQFDEAFNIVISHEGGYNNKKRDKGGETKFGISKRAYPNLDIKNLTLEQAKKIYKTDYWDKVKADLIVSRKVAIQMFDISINSGVKRAVLLAQSALCDMGYGIGIDGILGDVTLKSINKAGDILNSYLIERRKSFYRNIVLQDETQREFLNGWLNRANSFV